MTMTGWSSGITTNTPIVELTRYHRRSYHDNQSKLIVVDHPANTTVESLLAMTLDCLFDSGELFGRNFEIAVLIGCNLDLAVLSINAGKLIHHLGHRREATRMAAQSQDRRS